MGETPLKSSASAMLALGLISPTVAMAADHEVKMLNQGSSGAAMVFEPLVVKAAPGDTITFVPTDKSHNSVSMKDGIPSGAEPWKGKINEKITIIVTAPGVYMYQCSPHVGMGMIGAVVVGDAVNLDAVKNIKYPGAAKKTAEKIFSEIKPGS
jgi:pseudoazurin